MPPKSLPTNIINPFSESFLDTWDLWKKYKKEQFKFTYKGCISEQAALMQLVTLSEGKENIAIQVINQSIANGWRGLFMLKNNDNGTNQKHSPGRTITYDKL